MHPNHGNKQGNAKHCGDAPVLSVTELFSQVVENVFPLILDFNLQIPIAIISLHFLL